jgi:hypothetical protein
MHQNVRTKHHFAEKVDMEKTLNLFFNGFIPANTFLFALPCTGRECGGCASSWRLARHLI